MCSVDTQLNHLRNINNRVVAAEKAKMVARRSHMPIHQLLLRNQLWTFGCKVLGIVI